MTTPTTITLPGIVACLERFLRPTCATSGEGVQITQHERGTTVTACEGRHAATITTTHAGSLEPVLVDPKVFADADPSQPVKLYRLSQTSGVIDRHGGELVSVTLTPGELPRSATNLFDVVEGEIASGSTRAAFELDPRHLLAIAEALVAAAAEKVTVAIAPRWNTLAIIAQTPCMDATFLVAGETIDSTTSPADEDDAGGHDEADPLAFTIDGGAKTRRATTRRPKPSLACAMPADDIPF